MRTSHRLSLAGLVFVLTTAACGGNSALDPSYQPEVVNNPNVAFTFQATALQDVSEVVSYTWSASSGSIVIHPATATSSGTITLNIKDASGAVIYNGGVPASGDITPPTGTGGPWKVRVTLSNYTGTINFELVMQ